jgi:hypothetical protein
MRPTDMPPSRDGALYIPEHEVLPYLANGWTLVGDLTPHQVLMLPPSSAAYTRETPPLSDAAQ